MNFLFLSIEDLNDFIEPLGGHPEVRTPNIARLAARSAVFERAYATAPACSPARAAALFGQAPWRTGIYANGHDWRMVHKTGQRLSIVGHMRDAGFATIGAGKIFHLAEAGIDPDEWDDYFVAGRRRHPPTSALARAGEFGPNMDYGPAESDEPQYDELNAERIVAEMTRGADGRFWALGLFRPHLPCIVPQRFFDLYPEEVALPPGMPGPFDMEDERELASVPAEARRFIIRPIGQKIHRGRDYNAFLRAYLASISYADWLVGRLLDRLEDQGLMDSTTIVLWSDHGYQVGEKLAFTKFTLWERALRIPMMVAGPGIVPRRLGQPATNMDLFPTLLALAGARPKQETDGRDLSALLAGGPEDGDAAACAVWGLFPPPKGKDLLAVTARTRRHRFTRYWKGGEELYDHDADPFERRNLLAAPLLGRVARAGLRARLAATLPAPLAKPLPLKSREERLAMAED
ncbi:MAG: sulfatase [Pikeienuella sp.]|uniref:sulfatase n=1 Tax=Pikeienuella sp. TaxID=2831957 RepID=UPI00391AED04